MSRLEISLLGPFLVKLNSQQITRFDTEKTRALLAYLASESGQPQQREFLAEMLWPERPQGAARSNLRHALSYLRNIVGDTYLLKSATTTIPFLLVTRDTIQLNPASSIWVDTIVFTELLKGATTNPGGRIDYLEQAVALYRGSLLVDVSIGDSAEFQEWLWLKREGFCQAVLIALGHLVDCYRLLGNFEKARQFAWRQVELAPWNEEAHQNVMRLLALTGKRGAALAQYDSCRRFLREMLDVEPGDKTNQLYEQIRDGTLDELGKFPILVDAPKVDLKQTGLLEDVYEEEEYPCVVAREAELTRLEDFLLQMLNGRGNVIFVTGVAGQGKTALLSEFARRSITVHSNLLVAWGNCNFFSGVGDPYLPFRDALAMLTGDVESQWSSGNISRKHAQRLWSAFPRAIQVLLKRSDSLIGTFLEGKDLYSRVAVSFPDNTSCLEQLRKLIEQRSSATMNIEQTFLFENYTNFLRYLSEQYPLVLILDDLQWADSASVGLLFHLGRNLAKNNDRIMIICAYRPEEVALDHAGDRHPLVKVLNEFKRIFGDSCVNLDQIEEVEGRRFIDALLEIEPNKLTEEFRSALFRRTQGHPLFTVELLRAMQDRGDVVKDMEGYWIEAPALDWGLLPARVQAIIEERIDRLTPEQQQILSTASVEGEVFTVQVIAEVQKMEEKSCLDHLAQELERRHHLVKELGALPIEQGWIVRYQFRHSLFQEYIYKRLSLGERRLLHEDVAAVMENLYRGQSDEMAVQLAHHYYQAGDNVRAFNYSLLAAGRAARLYASDEIIKHATRAIEIATQVSVDTVSLINLYRDRGLAYETLGKFHEAFLDLEMSSQIAYAENEHRLECTTLIDLGKLLASRDYNQSYSYYEQALKLAREINDPAILASSLNWMGNWFANAERPIDSITYHHEALEILQDNGNQQELAKTLDLLGIACLLAGDTTSSKAYFDQAIALFKKLDDHSSLVSSLTGRGNIGGAAYISLAVSPAMKPCEARSDFVEALRIAREIGSPAAEAWVDWSLGLLEVVQGNFGAALDVIRNGLQTATEIGHGEWTVGNQTALGILYLELFSLDAAQQHLVQALKQAEALRSQYWINLATGSLTEIYILRNDILQAKNTLDKVISQQTPMDTMTKRYCWVRRAELALAQSAQDLALEITNRLIDSAPSIPQSRVITFLWKLKGEILTDMGRLEEAKSLLCAAKKNAEENGERYLLWKIHASLGKVYRNMNCLTSWKSELSMSRALIKALATTLQDEELKHVFRVFASSLIKSRS